MVRELVALRLDVGLDDVTGHAKYPNFNKIAPATRKGMDWSKYIDVHGSGMHYNKACGHKDDTPESPYGHQQCCICVPADFAVEALALFPDVVHECTAIEFEEFYNNKAHAHEPDDIIDSDVLIGLSAQRKLMKDFGKDTTSLDLKIERALDSNITTERGVRKNSNKKWADVSAKKGITIKKATA